MPVRLGRRSFADTESAVMAIVNRTPDSFYDAGATYELAAAIGAVDRAVADGAAIVDIGGVKAGTGPDVTEAEEIRRTTELIAAARERHPGVVLSIDTWRATVADAAVDAGADLLNDAWGGHDPALAQVAARRGVGLVCTHAGGLTPRTDPSRPVYADVTDEVISTVSALADRAVGLGVRPDAIVVDPGHDFAKTTVQSLQVTRHLDRVVGAGRPVLVALSRKDFIGETLDLPVDERLTGTLAATAVAAWLGVRFFRAHDVAATRQVLDMVASIKGDRPPVAARRRLG